MKNANSALTPMIDCNDTETLKGSHKKFPYREVIGSGKKQKILGGPNILARYILLPSE